jgi:molybdopterin-guanine dinucleotide biosynthesis protein A
LIAWSGVVLTGGASSRMGRDKALLEVDGKPMAVRVADALTRAGASEVFCVGGDTDGLQAHGLPVVPDGRPGEGPLGGLVTALSAARHDLVVVLACDLVQPSDAAIGRLVVSAGSAAATVPVVAERPQWLHAVWKRDACLNVLRAAFDRGERSVHRAAALLDVHLSSESGAGFEDADRPEDVTGGG